MIPLLVKNILLDNSRKYKLANHQKKILTEKRVLKLQTLVGMMMTLRNTLMKVGT